MTEHDGWFAGVDPDDADAAAARIRSGSADEPADWPETAVAEGFAADSDDYYARLHEATTAAAREAVHERERADDKQLIHAVRTMDDMTRILLYINQVPRLAYG